MPHMAQTRSTVPLEALPVDLEAWIKRYIEAWPHQDRRCNGQDVRANLMNRRALGPKEQSIAV
jgi:hypothetical protein